MGDEHKENGYVEFDHTQFDTVEGSNEGFQVRIFDIKTRRDTNLVITVLGKDSDEFLKVSRLQNKRRLEKMRKGGFRVGNMIPDPEEVEQDGIELLARCTKSWAQGDKNAVSFENGEELTCTLANVVRFYTKRPEIKDQVDTAIGDRANFIKGSSKP